MSEIRQVIQSPLFSKQKKKLQKNQIRDLDDAVRKILANPELGNLKIGDLDNVRVFKFRAAASRMLLAYEVSDEILYVYAVGVHENFYRDLKKYLYH